MHQSRGQYVALLRTFLQREWSVLVRVINGTMLTWLDIACLQFRKVTRTPSIRSYAARISLHSITAVVSLTLLQK